MKPEQVFDGNKPARLGTPRRPARVKVQSEERKAELAAIFERGGWAHEIEVAPDEAEDIADLTRLQNPVATVTTAPKPGRNEPCPCGSGKKFKKCCGK
jgi:SWIM/SEC-C metal-binding protein